MIHTPHTFLFSMGQDRGAHYLHCFLHWLCNPLQPQSEDIKGKSGRQNLIICRCFLLYVSDPLSSILHILDILKSFGRFSGYKFNLNKSELLYTTAASQIPFNSLPFKITHSNLTYLCITITISHAKLLKANFTELLDHTR